MTALKLLIVDDHDFFRRSILLPLDASKIEIVGNAISGEQAIDLCHALHPDVVLLDLNMSPLSGLVTLAQLITQAQPPAILVLTVRDDTESILKAFALGAHGYLRKDILTDDLLLSAIFAVANGGVFMDAVTFSALKGAFSSR